MIPQDLRQYIEQNFATAITQITPINGGDINYSARLRLANGTTLFCKWHANPPAGMFTAEAYGLTLLNQANALQVPTVYHTTPTSLIMEWLASGSISKSRASASLGHGLAHQHRLTANYYGLDQNNYCGLTPQINTPTPNWATFFAVHRLGYQMELAARRNRLPSHRQRGLERLIKDLPNILPANPPASLLHGDLWNGNWLVTEAGNPALIDPAVYYGHREADIAFTELFGGFSPIFYQTYFADWSPDPGYPERKPIYNLYHLLNHLNLFGEGYGKSVDIILARYT